MNTSTTATVARAGARQPRLRLLVLGGTRFVGRALVEAALAAGHEVSLFNRGQTNPDLFPTVERLRGDRNVDLSALAGRRWDVVLDVAAYHPDAVQRSTRALHKQSDRYVLISTLSVYADHSRPHGEEWPLLPLTDATAEGDLYGARKAACEAIVLDRFGARSLIIRAGLIVGRHDATDRFSYWPRRLARGGTILAPGDPADPLQFIDVEDLAGWTVRSLENGLCGIFNATGESITFADLLETCRRVTGSTAAFVWLPSERLLALGLDPWMGVPLWIAAPGWEAANRVEIARARRAGLTFRPLAETIRSAWSWDQERRAQDSTLAEGLSPAREQKLLASLADSPGR